MLLHILYIMKNRIPLDLTFHTTDADKNKGGKFMIEIRRNNINFDSIEVDNYWNLGKNTEHKVHKIHNYPAKFPAFITQKALEYASTEKINVNTIADIFCGCGTVAYEARREGIDFWGCDINPIAALIARVKSNKLDTQKLINIFNHIIIRYENDKDDFVTNVSNPRIIYWFNSTQIFELSLLKNCIKQLNENENEYKDFFMCAFSNILKPTSKWLTKSIKPQLDSKKIPSDVITSFRKQFEFMLQANQKSEAFNNSKVEIEVGNSLEISKSNSIDLIITSPPYVTSYEYADLHQLSLLWLDYADDYRDFRKDTIGSSYSSEERASSELNDMGSKIVQPLMKIDKSKARSVTKYYIDMQKIANLSYKMLTKNGAGVFVIGNTEYKDIRINNAEHLALSLFESGFSKVFVTKRKISGKILTPYRDAQGKFTSNSSGRKVYNEEFILIGRR
jgi:methylase of polypeptide subunit release factors